MKRLFTLLLFSAIICSCSSTRRMSLSVLEPAPVTISPAVKKVAVINRSLSEGKGKILDVAEKIFTLEGARLDKEGSEATISAFTNELEASKRFSAVKEVPYDGPGNNTPGMYASTLSWEEVAKICKEDSSELLFSLEMFDTDSKISYTAHPVKLNTPLGQVPAIEQEAAMLTIVKTGWRIYDPVNKYILDEAALARDLVFRGRGIDPTLAARALIGRKDAVKKVGTQAGYGYAYRVLPAWLRVSRDYYVRGNNSFKVARRKAEAGNWDGAGDIWYEQTKSAKRKVAGRGCYNMAIISEVNGEVEKAIEWAQQSYEDYNIKRALRYIRILEGRRYRNRILEEQIETPSGISSLKPGSPD